MLYFQLFFTFFKIGIFAFGGGAAMLPLLQQELVDNQQWLKIEDFTNMIAVSQMTPGPIGINYATYAGYLATGNIIGALVASFALVLPSYIIMSLLARLIFKYRTSPWVLGAMNGLKPTVVGLIGAACMLIVTEDTFGEGYKDWISWMIFILSFIAVKWLKVSPIIVLIMAGVLGIFLYAVLNI